VLRLHSQIEDMSDNLNGIYVAIDGCFVNEVMMNDLKEEEGS
jgi:hypothetical protein